METRRTLRKTIITVSRTILLIAAILFFLTPYALAVGVYTAREDGTATTTFRIGEKVRIIANAATPYNIIVVDPQGVTRYTETSNTITYDKTLNGITDKIGKWEVRITPRTGGGGAIITATTSTQYTATLANVVPEVPLGTISILIAFFAAFGIGVLRKRNKPKFPF